MTVRIKDIMNLPGAISNELEHRSQLRAEALANRIVSKVTGENLPQNPCNFNPYMNTGESTASPQSKSTWEKDQKNNWGRNGW